MNSMKIFSEDKDTRRNNNHHLSNMATQLKKGKNDWVHTKKHVGELSDLLGKNHIVIARKYEGMFNVHLASIIEMSDSIKKFAIDRDLNLKDSRTLKQFIEETSIIWT